MTKSVYGVFDSNAETIRAINTLKAKGYASDDITVVAKNEETMNLDNLNRTVDVNTVVTEDDSFIDKIVRFFVDDNRDSLSERLSNVGLSTREAEAYIEDVKDGKVLVIVEGSGNISEGNVTDQHSLGTASISTQEEADLREKNSISTGITNNPDPNIFPSTTSNALPQEEEHSVVTGDIAERPIYDPSNDLVNDEKVKDVSYAESSGRFDTKSTQDSLHGDVKQHNFDLENDVNNGSTDNLVNEKKLNDVGYAESSRGRFDGEENDPSTAIFPPTQGITHRDSKQNSAVTAKGESRQVNRPSTDELVQDEDNLNTVGYAANSHGRFDLDTETLKEEKNEPTLRDEQMDEKGYGVISRTLNKNEEETRRQENPINNRRD